MNMKFKLAYKQLGAHTQVVVRAGIGDSSLGLCGQLTFRNEEWSQFKATIEAATTALKDLAPRFEFVKM